MKSGEMVSVIIPTYNRSGLCRKAVESVLAQTHDRLEVLVVDDGSTDDTASVIAGMGDGRVRYLRQENAGVSAARNFGFLHATGDYIALLDSDDDWLPWKLEAQLSVLRAFPDAGMVWSDMTAIDESGNALYETYLHRMYDAYRYFRRDVHFGTVRRLADAWEGCPEAWKERNCYAGDIFSWMFMGNLVHTSTVLLRRGRREAVGPFDLELKKSGEDYDYHFRTCREGRVAYMDVPSIHYRVGATDQLTANHYNIYMARNDLRTITRMWQSSRDRIRLPGALICKRFAESHAWVGLAEFPENLPESRRHLLQSLRYDPFQAKPALYYCAALLPTTVLAMLRKLKRGVG